MTNDYGQANHAPDVTVKEGNEITAKAGEIVTLSANASDPDGDELTYYWYQYKEAGTYGQDVVLTETDAEGTMTFTVPEDASGSTIHMLVRVTDSGKHNLTHYQRVIITVE